jgi:hypothetical protein
MKQEERLYALGGSKYVQYEGNDEMPDALKRYIEEHNGEMPPYIPLPCKFVEFRMEWGGIIPWSGQGRLPDRVIDYVKENGCLPWYNDDE